jgi:hypothetical protein
MPITIGGMTVDDLTAGELALGELATRLPGPTEARNIQGIAGALFGGRALDLHRGFLHELDGPSTVGPTIMARPLVELAILVRWIQDDPELRFEMWTAHSEDMDARAIRQLAVNLPRPPGDPFEPAAVQPTLDAKDARATAARTAGGRETPPRLLPGLVEMIEAVLKRDPDEGLALRQAYDAAFRSISPATHSDASSFKESIREQPDGSLEFVETSPVPIELLRYISAACFAYAIEASANLCGETGTAQAALAIRLRLAQPPAA